MVDLVERKFRFLRILFPFLDFLSYAGSAHTFWASSFYVIELLLFFSIICLMFFDMHLLAAALSGSAAMAHSYNVHHIQEFWRQALSIDKHLNKNLFLYKYMWLIDISSKSIVYFSIFIGNLPLICFTVICYCFIFYYSYVKWNNP